MASGVAISEPSAQVKRPCTVPVSVIVPVRNEQANLRRCLESLVNVGEVYVVDSSSSDETVEIARQFGAKVVQFQYRGGWPKKRQWAMDNLPLAYDWILLVDADESLTSKLEDEIRLAIENSTANGYYIGLQMHFLGRQLRHGGAGFEKLCLFRKNHAAFECRVEDQDDSMCDMEVHEHMVVHGETSKLRNRLRHDNTSTLARYIAKHNDYSNWEAAVWKNGNQHRGITPSLFGTQAQRRRWLRAKFFRLPGSPVLFFLYRYLFRLGFLDGTPGLIYCGMQGIQFFHIKAKIYEMCREPAVDGRAC